jgi:hypothetical protein
MCRDSGRGPRPRCSLMTIDISMSLAMILSFAQLATEEFWEKVMGLLNERVPLRP